MALQQVIPDFVPAGGLGVGQIRPLKRMVAPVRVSFRKGGSLGALVDTVKRSYSVAIDAAAGAGKSTVVPGALLEALGGLLVHVLPTGFLASELFKYLSASRTDCVLVSEQAQEWPDTGWVLTSASVIQAKFLSTAAMELPGCVVYHDEVHRSDAWTYLLAHQWGTIRGVNKYVTASATGGVGGFRQLETSGSLEVKQFSSKLCEDLLDVSPGSGLPWSVDSITGNTLVFEDRARHADHLVDKYSQVGFSVYRLHSRMRDRVFESAMASLKSAEITVLVADSTFRDGYTFELATIIDVGVIETTSVVEGSPTRVRRWAYEGEIYQGAARGGRTDGLHTVAWRPDHGFERKRVALEAVEIDAVALVSRLLCTLIPMGAADSKLAEGAVPRDLLAALRGTQPLACLAGTQMAELSEAGYARAPSPVLKPGVDVLTPGIDYQCVGVSADTGNKYSAFAAPSVSSASASTGASTRESVATTAPSSVGAADWTVELASWAAETAVASVELECGTYYYSPSVRPDQVACAGLPDGWASVVRLFGAEYGALQSCDLTPQVRAVAVAAGLQRFNMLSCEKNAVMAVAKDVRALGRTRSGPMVNLWMNQLLERATALQVEASTVSRVLIPMVANFCEVMELPSSCLDVECRNLASQMFERLRLLPSADVTPQMAVEVTKGYMPSLPTVRTRDAVVIGAPDGHYVEMAKRGRASRAKPQLTSFDKWVLGYNCSPSVRRRIDSISNG